MGNRRARSPLHDPRWLSLGQPGPTPADHQEGCDSVDDSGNVPFDDSDNLRDPDEVPVDDSDNLRDPDEVPVDDSDNLRDPDEVPVDDSDNIRDSDEVTVDDSDNVNGSDAVPFDDVDNVQLDRDGGESVIELAFDDRLLARFASDLDTTSPREVPTAPDLSHYAEVDREAARLAWANRIYDEYRSVAIFTELLGLLTDIEAPYAALCAVHRLIGDELRHTQLTATVVDWLGGRADLDIDLRDVGLPPRGDEPASVRAVKIVAREIVVAEEESIYALAAYRAATTEPAIHAVFDLLLADEVRHAAAGRALLRTLAPGRDRNSDDDRDDRDEGGRALATMMAADRAELRAQYIASAYGGPGRALGACIERADLDAIWATRRAAAARAAACSPARAI